MSKKIIVIVFIIALTASSYCAEKKETIATKVQNTQPVTFINESFKDNTNSWTLKNDKEGSFVIENDKYRLKSISKYIRTTKNVNLEAGKNYLIEAKITLPKSKGNFDIIFGNQKGKEEIIYIFSLSESNSYKLSMYNSLEKKSTDIIPWLKTLLVRESNKIEFERKGEDFLILINNKQLEKVKIDNITINNVGFGINPNTEIEIDNLIVKNTP